MCVSDVKLRKESDQNAGEKTGDNGQPDAVKFNTENKPHDKEGNDGYGWQKRCAAAQRPEKMLLVGVFLRFHREGAGNGADNADRRDDKRNGDGRNAADSVNFTEGEYAESAGADDGTDIGFIEVGAHAGHVAHVVADIIGYNGRVAGSSSGMLVFDLADEIGAHVCALGEDTAADAGEERHGGRAHTEGDHRRGDVFKGFVKYEL